VVTLRESSHRTWGDSGGHTATANVPDLDPLPPEGRAILRSASEVILDLGGLYNVLDEDFTAQLRAYHDAALQAGQAEPAGKAGAAAALAERMLT
jgi:hypothetical protein